MMRIIFGELGPLRFCDCTPNGIFGTFGWGVPKPGRVTGMRMGWGSGCAQAGALTANKQANAMLLRVNFSIRYLASLSCWNQQQELVWVNQFVCE